MAVSEHVLESVRQALRSEPRVGLQHHTVHLSLADGDLVLEGEVADIAAKKLALERAAAVPALKGIVDRLRVTPAQRMGDSEISTRVSSAIAGEPVFANCTIRAWSRKHPHSIQVAEPAAGTIEIVVEDGVVTLDGDVPGLGLKRLAGLLAWWVPGSRDVVNGLGVTPPEADSDDEITDAVRIALERDPFVNPDQIRVSTHNAVVTLQGVVPTASEREMAEFDAWYIFGVDKVVNQIRVHA